MVGLAMRQRGNAAVRQCGSAGVRQWQCGSAAVAVRQCSSAAGLVKFKGVETKFGSALGHLGHTGPAFCVANATLPIHAGTKKL